MNGADVCKYIAGTDRRNFPLFHSSEPSFFEYIVKSLKRLHSLVEVNQEIIGLLKMVLHKLHPFSTFSLQLTMLYEKQCTSLNLCVNCKGCSNPGIHQNCRTFFPNGSSGTSSSSRPPAYENPASLAQPTLSCCCSDSEPTAKFVCFSHSVVRRFNRGQVNGFEFLFRKLSFFQNSNNKLGLKSSQVFPWSYPLHPDEIYMDLVNRFK